MEGAAVTVGALSAAAPPTRGSAPVLAETKLQIPAPRADAVPREALVGVLIAGGGTRLTLVDAPPGSGKTSLLSQWNADPREERPFAWISLDGGDNDPVRFWDGVIAALRTVVPDTGADAQTALHSPGTTVGDHVLPLLVNELAALAKPLVLVLDDYHVVSNEALHDGVALLIERLPATVHLVISTRSDPALPLGRLRARAQLTEIRIGELRFSRDEAERFLNDVLGLDLEARDVARLQERTEGWVAGLQLAGLSLRGREDRAAFIESFAGDDRQIVDYLGFEVLDDQSQTVRDFMLRTSILDRLSGPLCAHVAEMDDAAQLLAALEHANLFVLALDSKRDWYRYHQLFAELLRHELAQTHPDLIPILHRRAAEWYRNEGAIHEAIEHATAASDFAYSIELITMHWYEFLQRGRLETVAGWIDGLPASTVTNEPNLCLTKAWLGVNMGRLDLVDRWLGAAERLAAERPDAGQLPPLESGIASLRAIHRYMGGNVGAAVDAGRHALDLERGGPASPWRPVGCPVLGLALHWRGHADDALATLSDAARIAGEDGNHLAAMHASGGIAAIVYQRGDLEAAEHYAAQATAIAHEHGLGEHWAGSLSAAVLGQVLDRRGHVDEADRAIAHAVELANRGVALVEIAYGLVALAEVRHERGRNDEAQLLRQRARAAVGGCADAGILGELMMRLERRLAVEPQAAPTSGTGEPLSDAELAVLRLLRSDLSQREIGAELFISLNTVKTHARNIYRKLAVATRADAVSRARDLELL